LIRVSELLPRDCKLTEKSVLDNARGQEEILLKEALYVQMTLTEDHSNWDRSH